MRYLILLVALLLACDEPKSPPQAMKMLATASSKPYDYYLWGKQLNTMPVYPYEDGVTKWLVGDFNLDKRVDSADRQTFIYCHSGPGVASKEYLINLGGYTEDGNIFTGYWILKCSICDYDYDGDVDSTDFGVLQNAYSNSR